MHGTCSQVRGISAISTTPLEAVAPIPLSFSTVFESRSFLDNEINFVLGYLRQFRDKDHYTSEFEQMITLTESLINKPRADSTSVLSFDMNIVPPLFFVALNYRVLRLRQQAVALLKTAPEREGIWRRDSVIKVCVWKIMVEEQGRGQLAETDMLPESARIFREHIPETDWGKFSENARPRIHSSRGDAGIVENVSVPDGFENVYGMGNML